MLFNSVHSLLDNKNWNIDDLRVQLSTNSTTINETSPFRDSPLVRVLKSKKCSLAVVRLLLDHGATVHCNAGNRHSPLNIAIRFVCCDSVIRELLERGSDVKGLEKNGQSCICVALQAGAPKSVLRLLLESGCSPNACQHHVSVLHCASFRPGLQSEVLEMFLRAGADIKPFGRWGQTGQSPLCFALRGGVDAQGLRLLLACGTKLDVCTRHESTLLCATENVWGAPLKAGLVKALLDAGATTGRTNRDGWAPLQLALRYCKYEDGAIKALLDLPDLNVNGPTIGWKGDTLLHLAVDNSHCRLEVVRLLLNRGAKVDKENFYADTPLHLAVMNEECNAGVVGLLLEKGAPVNARNKKGKSPLRVAIEREQSCDVLHLLLAAGAKIGIVKDSMDVSLLKLALDMLEGKRTREQLDRLEVIVTYSFLEDSDFTMEYLTPRWSKHESLMKFAEKCVEENKKMALKDVSKGRTLKKFLTRRFYCRKNPESNRYNLCRLFRIISGNDFPTYFNVISAKIGRTVIKGMLQQLRVFALKESFGKNLLQSSGLPVEEHRIFLNFVCLGEISRFLPTPDILRLVLAYYVPHNRPGCLAGIEDSPIRGSSNQIKTEECRMVAEACKASVDKPNTPLLNEPDQSLCSNCLPNASSRRNSRARRKRKKRKNSSFPPTDNVETNEAAQKTSETHHRLPKRKRAKERKQSLTVKNQKEVPVSVHEKNCVHIS